MPNKNNLPTEWEYYVTPSIHPCFMATFVYGDIVSTQ